MDIKRVNLQNLNPSFKANTNFSHTFSEALENIPEGKKDAVSKAFNYIKNSFPGETLEFDNSRTYFTAFSDFGHGKRLIEIKEITETSPIEFFLKAAKKCSQKWQKRLPQIIKK